VIGRFRKKRSFAIVGTLERTILAEIRRETSAAEPALHLLAATEGAPDQKVTLNRLLATLPDMRGTVSVALPLYFFEVVTVTMPAIPEEAIGKTLPYHLAKALAKPLQDFIYDWQLNRRTKDSLEITAYLFPIATFNILRNELSRKQLELRYLEPDVFAVFAYLDLTGRLPVDQTTLCSLVWPGSTSHAIYEHGQLKMVRSVPIIQPATPFPASREGSAAPGESARETAPRAAEGGNTGRSADVFGNDADHTSILANFSLVTRRDEVATAPPVPDFLASASPRQEDEGFSSRLAPAANWPEYINNLGLEIIRTTDFYGRILKGANISRFFLGGGEEFLLELASVTRPAMNLEPEELIIRRQTQDLPAPFEAICIGTGVR
jgi:hypothetical protein